MHQGSGDQEGLGELRLNDLGRAGLRRPTAELVAVSGEVRLDRHQCDLIGPLNFELRSCRQGRIDRRMQRPATGIRFVAQRLAAESRAQVAQQR